MSSCENAGMSHCHKSDSISSEGSEIGKWIGTAIGVWAALMVLIWVIRTCVNRTRREKCLNRLCLKRKPATRQRPPANPPMSTRTRNTDLEIVYYKTCMPPSYDETMRSPPQYYHPSPCNGIAQNNPQYYLPTSPNGISCLPASFQFCMPCSGFLPYRIHKYRGSISTLSISLPPIEEDVESSAPSTPKLSPPDEKTTVITMEDCNGHTSTSEDIKGSGDNTA